jgi:hypothetical protein
MLRYARAPSPRCRFRAPDVLQFILEGKPKCLQGRIRVLIMSRLRQPPNLECNSLHCLSLLMSATIAEPVLELGDRCSEVYNLIGNADAFLAQNSGKLRGRCAC